MEHQPETKQTSPIQINTNDELSRGRYSNLLLITHSPDEFILDWILNSPNGPHLLSRIIVSPGHAKSIIEALTHNINQYEEKFGPVRVIEKGDQKYH